MIHRFLRTALAVLPLSALAVGASAQTLDDLLGALRGGGGPGTPVDAATERQALETAGRSFEEAARAMSERLAVGADSADASAAHRARHVETAQREFVAGARERVVHEKRDGLLTRAELSEALAAEREVRLERLEEAVRAALDGARPPPSRSDYERHLRYAAALAGYTLSERNPPWRFAVCIGFLLVGLAVAGLLARGLVLAAQQLDGRGARLAARAAEQASGPFYLAATAIALRAALDWVWLPFGVVEVVHTGTVALLAVSALWIAWGGASGVAGVVAWMATRTRGRIDDEALDLIRKALRIGALALFAAFLVNALFGAELSSILAAVGVVGVVASIAAQDTLRNLMGSVTVHGDRPFGVGDLIRWNDYFGTVEEIGFRSTRVRTLDGHRVTVPNAEVVREAVENVSARPYVRHHYAIDLVYGTAPKDVKRAVEILQEILEEAGHPEGKPPVVSFEEFAAYSLRLLVWWYSDTSDYWEARAHRTRVNLEILERFGAEGFEFAFPTRSVHLLSELDAVEEEVGE